MQAIFQGESFIGCDHEGTIPVNRQEEFIGGRGFGISYLVEEMQGGLDPLGEDNKLMFMPGVLAGTAAQGFGRWIVMTKSPLTGGLARSVGAQLCSLHQIRRL